MIKKTISFYGAQRDQFGMPTPFSTYFCVASDDGRYATATAIPITIDAVALNPAHVYLTGKQEDAMDELIARLRALPNVAGLKEIEQSP